MASSCLRTASSRSSMTCAKPANSGKSSADALPLIVWATRNISSSSSRLPGSASAAIKCCSVRSKPSSDSARNAATTFVRSKFMIFLDLLRPGDSVIGIEDDFPSHGSAGFLRDHGNASAFHQIQSRSDVFSAQASGITVTNMKKCGSAENLGAKIGRAAPKSAQLLEQDLRGFVCESQRGRLTLAGHGKQKMIHPARTAPLIPEANGHTRSKNRLDLARFRRHVQLSRQ